MLEILPRNKPRQETPVCGHTQPPALLSGLTLRFCRADVLAPLVGTMISSLKVSHRQFINSLCKHLHYIPHPPETNGMILHATRYHPKEKEKSFFSRVTFRLPRPGTLSLSRQVFWYPASHVPTSS